MDKTKRYKYIKKIKKFLCFPFFLYTQACTTYHEPEYEIQQQFEHFEIRLYKPSIVAEVFVDKDFETAGNSGFQVLAKYIFGNNYLRQSEQADPSNLDKKNTQISMTAPVDMQQKQGGYIIRFHMPAKYSLDTLPQPKDQRIKIKLLEPKLVAARKYSGSWSKTSFLKEKQKLSDAILKTNTYTINSRAIFSRYNSPWTLWFLRRNEVLFEVSKDSKNN